MDDIDKEERNMQKNKLKQLYQFCDDYSKIAFDEKEFGRSFEINREKQEKTKEVEYSSIQSSLSSISHSPSIDLNRMPNPAMIQLGLPLQSIYSLYLTVNESKPTEKEIAIVQSVINREVESMKNERNAFTLNRPL